MPDGDAQQPAQLARHPAGDDPALARPTCSSGAPTSTWRSRCPCSPRPTSCRARRWPARCFVGELTSGRRAARGARGAADGAGRGKPGHPPGLRPGAAGRRGSDGAGAGGARHAVARAGRAPSCAGDEVPEAPPVAPMSGSRLLAWRGQDRLDEPDLADLAGLARRPLRRRGGRRRWSPPAALRPQGLGQDDPGRADRRPSCPTSRPRSRSELTALHSLAGALEPGDPRLLRPPYSAPHHDASKASLFGGGTGLVRPGEISRAHCGVLFLDEFPLFRADVIEALRQPLESGEVTIARGDESATYPARGMVVLAANPCPCGEVPPVGRAQPVRLLRGRRAATTAASSAGPSSTGSTSPATWSRCGPHEIHDPLAVTESSAQVRARVTRARERQAERYAEQAWRLNGQAPGPVLPGALAAHRRRAAAGRRASSIRDG